ncbi:hypothetical protein K431DRAFT_318323 [Polychaeton citri CBS 116435]|uniref:Uncharacterized protein n=1 Tax=Polychaeton citri CBS 116435 TaxID=1314669 RepID=A0A9P4QGR0_9PEZI|nr:hypothetical protein K431DRAFT_318323 [Polychaeton citri CBS 116435]
MASKDASLYGFQRPKNLHGKKEISSSQSLSFTSQLSSLIDSSNSQPKQAPSRKKPKKQDIFAKHNRDTAKRAKRDQETENKPAFSHQKHTTDGLGVDRDIWERSRRKMQEKARIYAAMKRGDLEDVDERYTVDFDRKWVERAGRLSASESDSDDDGVSGDDKHAQEIVDYVDEFGRPRKGTRAEAHRAELEKQGIDQRRMEDLSDRFTARPSAPANVIYGDTIQHQAFLETDAMDNLAALRDKSLTPPPDLHFDAKREFRQKGTGFFQFVSDKEERKVQMEGLDELRKQTEEKRRETSKRKADEFLDELGADLEASHTKRDKDDVD